MEKFTIYFLVVLAIFGSHTEAQVSFQAAEYSYTENADGDGGNSVTLTLERTVFTSQETVSISSVCPCKVTCTATSADYSVGTTDAIETTVTFLGTSSTATLTIVIKDDVEEEFREFFCLTITTNPGTQYYTKVYIPGNDYCVNLDSPGTMNPTETNVIGDPASVIYVGPWCVGDTGIPDTINIDVTPEPGGASDDIFIWLSDFADQNDATIQYYGLFLDDNTADTTHNGGAGDGVTGNGDSIVVKTDIDGPVLGRLGGDIVNAGVNSFELQYTESNGEIDLTKNGNTYGVNDPGTLDVSHLLVSSGGDEVASWKICGLSPRKIPAVAVDASGSETGYPPENAVNKNRSPTRAKFLNGFISNSQVDPWIQIDLGREYDVKMVLIWPIATVAAGPAVPASDPGWLQNADVYVGSCDSSSTASITSNNVCDNNIPDVNGANVVEVQCSGTNYGRYVYILQDTTSAVQIAFSEVEVYGDDVPLSDQATVQFSSSTFGTMDDESATTVAIMATRSTSSGSSAGLTCTSVDFCTDTVTTPPYGNLADFTPVNCGSKSKTTMSWSSSEGSGTTITVSVTIDDDTTCEPEETFNVWLTNVNGGIIGCQTCSSAVTIVDDDSVTYALSSATFNVPNEGDSVNIGVSRTGNGIMQAGSIGLEFTDGTALSGDYNSADGTISFTSTSTSPQYYTVSTEDDEIYEGDGSSDSPYGPYETFTVDITNLQPSTCSNAGSPSSATVTITDNDSLFWFDHSSNTVNIKESTAQTTIQIARRGVVQDKTVNIDIDEVDADTPTDFTLSDITTIVSNSEYSKTFDATDASESIFINVVDDSEVENDESFTLTLRDPLYTTGHKNLRSPYQLTIIIEDDDATYTWKQAEYSGTTEGGSQEVCLLRSGDTSTSKTVQISSTSGTATSNEDFTPLTSIMFFDGETEKCVNIAITDDIIVENTEMFTLTIDQGVATGAINSAQVYITDNDNNAVSWEQTLYTFDEPSSNVVYIIRPGGGNPITLTIAPSGTATPNVDFTAVSSVTLSGDRAQIPITIINDNDYDPNESFTLTFSGTGISSQTTTITIVDDDPASTTPPPPDTGLGGGAIAGIIVAALVGTLALIAAIGICGYCWFTNGRVATPAPAAAAPAAYPLANFPSIYPGYDYGGYKGYGNGISNGALSPYSNQGGLRGFNQGFNQYGFP